jgi:cell wall-associated NlpC family hydrolase
MTASDESTSGRLLAAGLLAAALAVIGLVSLIGLFVVIISPATSASCLPGSGSGGVAISPVSVPPGLSATARQVWDTPLQMQPGHWYPVGATEYYDGDGTGSGHFGSIPDPAQSNLDEHPDTFAELSLLPSNPANGGTFTFADANALGNLPYMTGLRVAREGKSIVVYKRDTGYGQGPSEHTAEGFEYRIDLWGPSAQALGVSKDQVDVELAPKTGAGEILEVTPGATTAGGSEQTGESAQCEAGGAAEGPLPLTPGQTAKVLPDGLAAAPAEAPQAVKDMIAAGNRLYGKPYVLGGAHGTPLAAVQPGYDCSSAVSFVLYAGGVFGEQAEDSTELESYGEPGPGQWVTVYANSEHAFMYVAGIRFDTSYKGTDTGPNEGQIGPRWRVYDEVPKWAQWVVRHPPGL